MTQLQLALTELQERKISLAQKCKTAEQEWLNNKYQSSSLFAQKEKEMNKLDDGLEDCNMAIGALDSLLLSQVFEAS